MKKRLAAILCCLLLLCLLPTVAYAGSDGSFNYDSESWTLTIWDPTVLDESGFVDYFYNKAKTIVIGAGVDELDDGHLESFLWSGQTSMIVFMSPDTGIKHTMPTLPESVTMPLVHGYADSSAQYWATDCLATSFSAHAFGNWFDLSTASVSLEELGVFLDTEDQETYALASESIRNSAHVCQCTICLQYLMASHNFKQDPATGKMVCSVCNHTEGTEQFNLIDASKTFSLSPGVPFTFGAGTYQVSGDPTIYNGNQNFFVRDDGQFTFTRR